LLGVDDDGDSYFFFGYTHENPFKEYQMSEAYVMVYSPNGNKISEISLDLNYFDKQISENQLRLDIHGSVIQSWFSKDGLHILKWMKN